MFFIFQIFDPICLSGPTWVYVGEICPTHLRAKGMCLASASVCLANVIYLQAAPVAFKNIGWKFYILFIVLCFIGAVCIWFIWPDTRGLPLEEVAAIFGDADEVAIYQREIEIDHNTNTIINHHSEDEIKKSHDMSLGLVAKDVSLEGDNAKDHVSCTEDVNIES